MKKIIILACIIAICTSLFACTPKGESIVTPVNFYYKAAVASYNDPAAIIRPEVREGAGFEENILGLLDLYLAGPKSDDYLSPFPSGISIVSFEIKDEQVNIVLSEKFGSLSGISLTIACSCICQTVTELTGCENISISAENILIDGSDSILVNNGSFLYFDSSYQTAT